jgi:hypothetical protein
VHRRGERRKEEKREMERKGGSVWLRGERGRKRKERKRKGESVSDVSVCEWLGGDKPIFSQPTVC